MDEREYDLDEMEEEAEDPKKDRVIQNKLKFLLLCFLVFCIPILWFFAVGNPVDADFVCVTDIQQTEEGKLELSLVMPDSASVFTITTQKLEGNTLIIKPRFSLVGIHKSGVTTITTKVPVDELDHIYIQGDDENDRQLVWSNTEA